MPQSQNTEPKLTRRGKIAVGTAAAGIVFGALGIQHGPAVIEHITDKSHDTHVFSRRDLAQKERSDGELPAGTGLIVAEQGDTPQGIASEYGAVDIRRVGDEIAGQAGGAANLQPGQELLLPTDQLEDTHLIGSDGQPVANDSEGMRYLVPDKQPDQQ